MTDTRGLVFDVRRFCLHDGPGIRTTVFLKGCFLRCPWCHNPEGVHPLAELMYDRARCIAGCNECSRACPNGMDVPEALEAGAFLQCAAECGRCAEACPTQALTRVGAAVSAQQVLDTVLSDEAFYRVSGGGVTVSGGEPLFQPDFLLALLRLFRRAGLHVAVETSACGDPRVLSEVLEYANLVLLDVKYGTPKAYERYLSAPSGELVWRNIETVVTGAREVVVRFPCIPGYTDTVDNVTAIATALASIRDSGRIRVEVLPYNPLGRAKSGYLRRPAPAVASSYRFPPSEAAALLEHYGFMVSLYQQPIDLADQVAAGSK